MPGLRVLQAVLLIAGIFLFSPVWAVNIEGVRLAERVQQAQGVLVLNGAGVRSKFFFDIYIAALYLPAREHQADRVLQHPAPARVVMPILYKQVGAGRLVYGWRAGFEKNQNTTQLQALALRLDAFNAMFSDAYRGDVLLFDFLADGTTHVLINDVEKGVVAGSDFQRALLAVWLGRQPADATLKKAMLGF